MKSILIAVIVLAFSMTEAAFTVAAGPKPVQLPKPQVTGGKPLMQALKNRRSTRSFSSGKIPAQTLSNLLWAAFGVNRPDSGNRTAPSALNRQEIDIYVATAEGVFLFDGKNQNLLPVLDKDIRALTGTQPYVKDAPVNLVYVADFSKIKRAANEDMILYSAADAGFISENVYLFCASEGLATVVRGSIDRSSLARVLKLRPEQKIILAQSVGYPK
jgi:SagB-type dehydrogenase family enzyme